MAIHDVTGDLCRECAALELRGAPTPQVEAGSLETLGRELMTMSRVVTGMQAPSPTFMGLRLIENPALPIDVVELVHADGRRQTFRF